MAFDSQKQHRSHNPDEYPRKQKAADAGLPWKQPTQETAQRPASGTAVIMTLSN